MKLQSSQGGNGFFEGQMLLAMPSIGDPWFERSVVYMCNHSSEGAMGLVINRRMDWLSFEELLEQLEIELNHAVPDIPIHAGGPVETGRGFVLHTPDYVQDSTLLIGKSMALTATVDILKAVAKQRGPRAYLLALGYASWAAGQLESELSENSWLTLPADEGLIFNTDLDKVWSGAMAKLGVDISQLSAEAGHA